MEKGKAFFHILEMTHHSKGGRMLFFLISRSFQQLISSCTEEQLQHLHHLTGRHILTSGPDHFAREIWYTQYFKLTLWLTTLLRGKVMETQWLGQHVTFKRLPVIAKIFFITVGSYFTFVWMYVSFAHVKEYHGVFKHHLLSLPTEKGLHTWMTI